MEKSDTKPVPPHENPPTQRFISGDCVTVDKKLLRVFTINKPAVLDIVETPGRPAKRLIYVEYEINVLIPRSRLGTAVIHGIKNKTLPEAHVFMY